MTKGKMPPVGRDNALRSLKALMKGSSSTATIEFMRAAFYRERTVTRDYRGECLTAVAMLDASLQDALETRFEALNSDRRKELFSDSSNGPLSTFSNKIRMAQALGFFGPELRKDLDLLRSIRNTFAHAHQHVDFSTNEVTQACRLLNYSHVLVGSGYAPDDYVHDPARCFFAVCYVAAIMFVQIIPKHRHEMLIIEGPTTWRLK
ncbi:hypothetical protein [Reyranella sp.]|uniref:hypothetical protein n=1 Tax=Reyranella sp. TaxID=1929291 RepID=UPI003BAAD127